MAFSKLNRFAGTSSAEQFRRDLGQCISLSREAERELALRGKLGDIAARNRVIETVLPYVVLLAKKLSRAYSGIPIEDLIQEGNLGAIRAFGEFNPDRGIRFLTFAHWNILWRMSRVQRRVRYPVASLDADLEEYPIDHRVLRHAGDRLTELDERPEDRLDKEALRKSAASAVRRLPLRERCVIKLLYGLGGHKEHSHRDVGRLMGVSKQRIHQLEIPALIYLFLDPGFRRLAQECFPGVDLETTLHKPQVSKKRQHPKEPMGSQPPPAIS